MNEMPDRFWSYVEKGAECWEWSGVTSPDGYGRYGTSSLYGTALPHRILWILENGAVPDGLELDHTCNNRACVNPDHLEPVTHAENIRRAAERRTECRNGHPIEFQVSDYQGGRRCLICRRAANRESTRRWRETNKAHRAAYAREYRKRQREAKRAA